ncbi:redox-sensitive transcriptional activator SoxR [Maricaulis sp.]|uniref:redox-sensitive transcriptional activator SoxR n=1 Tax=Maricaulis sp. TaxID=1486257 RepID=UPI000C5BB3E2|nr:redox-sensitive transcriptional activator SoxR [Maricaulis sp.]MAC89578.1 redox-sensitive transcriptional activator SoxR [Maricaulis sp.]
MESKKLTSPSATDPLSIGQLAERTSVSVSAIRFYEDKGLVQPSRNAGGQRRFKRADVRRISFILIAQQLGLTIREIGDALTALPDRRTPTQADWARISTGLKDRLDQQIDELTRMRGRLDSCIGCGCLSLKACQLYNPRDRLAGLGAGPHFGVTDPPD